MKNHLIIKAYKRSIKCMEDYAAKARKSGKKYRGYTPEHAERVAQGLRDVLSGKRKAGTPLFAS